VVINDLNIFGALCRPDKTHTPLLIDANTVLPAAVARQLFKMVAGRRLKELQGHCCSQLSQLALSDFLDVGKPSTILAYAANAIAQTRGGRGA